MVERDIRVLLAGIVSGFAEFESAGEGYGPDGPLDWTGYGESRARARERSGETESVVCGRGRIGETEAVVVAFDFRFLGGSIGTATGARIVHAFGQAITSRLPVVSMISTGGSRMQEGM